MFLLTGIALATSSTSSVIEIYAFDQNPAGSDKGNEFVYTGITSRKNDYFWSFLFMVNFNVALWEFSHEFFD